MRTETTGYIIQEPDSENFLRHPVNITYTELKEWAFIFDCLDDARTIKKYLEFIDRYHFPENQPDQYIIFLVKKIVETFKIEIIENV